MYQKWMETFVPGAVLHCLHHGSTFVLAQAFLWENTPEGWHYWWNVCEGDVPFSQEVRDRLEAMLIEYERWERGDA